MQNELNTEKELDMIFESEYPSIEKKEDSNCRILIKLVNFYENTIYLLSFLGFFGIVFIISNYLEAHTDLEAGIAIFLSILLSVLFTIINVLYTRGFCAFVRVIVEIARSVRK